MMTDLYLMMTSLCCEMTGLCREMTSLLWGDNTMNSKLKLMKGMFQNQRSGTETYFLKMYE